MAFGFFNSLPLLPLLYKASVTGGYMRGTKWETHLECCYNSSGKKKIMSAQTRIHTVRITKIQLKWNFKIWLLLTDLLRAWARRWNPVWHQVSSLGELRQCIPPADIKNTGASDYEGDRFSLRPLQLARRIPAGFPCLKLHRGVWTGDRDLAAISIFLCSQIEI